jgi:hypothetical protein
MDLINMTRRYWSAAAVAAVVLFAIPTARGQAQDQKVPRLSNGKPDLSGLWERPTVFDMSQDHTGCNVSFRPDCTNIGAKELSSLYTPFAVAENKKPKLEYTRFCLPWGYIRSWNAVTPSQLVQTSDYLAILFEQDNWFHVVPTDGRDHPKDLQPTWYGDSVGKWDGDTLVIDTIGYNGKTWLDTGGQHITTESMHTIERISRPDFQHLNYEVTIIDPQLYTRPWKNTRVFALMKSGQGLLEYSCTENNKAAQKGYSPEILPDEHGGKPPCAVVPTALGCPTPGK